MKKKIKNNLTIYLSIPLLIVSMFFVWIAIYLSCVCISDSLGVNPLSCLFVGTLFTIGFLIFCAPLFIFYKQTEKQDEKEDTNSGF